MKNVFKLMDDFMMSNYFEHRYYDSESPLYPKPSTAFKPFRPSVLFVGHVQTVQTASRRSILLRLISVSTVCFQNLIQNLNKKEKYYPATLKTEMDWSI